MILLQEIFLKSFFHRNLESRDQFIKPAKKINRESFCLAKDNNFCILNQPEYFHLLRAQVVL